jgi:ribose 5-phosphate isomerase B
MHKDTHVFFGSDHAGFALKNALVAYVRELGYTVVDLGPEKLNTQDDYPDLIAPVAREVMKKKGAARGIILGGSGQGEAIVANRFKDIRAAVYYGGPLEIVKLSRVHNDANMLSLGARFMSEAEAKEAVHIWLETAFSGDPRHTRRIGKLARLTKKILRFK